MSSNRRKRRRKSVEYFDYSLLVVIIFLVGFGLVMLYSSSSYEALTSFGDSMYYLKRQTMYTLVGFAFMVFVSKFPYRIYEEYCVELYAAAMFLMMLVLSPIGVEVNGARRWIRVAGFSFQPSETMKVAVSILIPCLIGKMGELYHTLKGTAVVFAVAAFSALAVYKLTDNLSAGIIVLGIACVIIFVAHRQTLIFGIPVVLILGGIGFLLCFGTSVLDSSNFRMRRILSWLDPETYAATGAYQTLQGLYAIGSGGFFGKGLGNSVQKMQIPEAQNDMILSIICEELGVFGAIMVFLLFGLLLYRLLVIARNAPDTYSALLVTGIIGHIALQVILNVAVVTNVIPNTGVTLPFISYGGTASVILLGEMGIALNISRYIKID